MNAWVLLLALYPLIELPEQSVDIRAWMKQYGWESKRHKPDRFEVGDRRLRLVSEDDSVLIGTRAEMPVDPHAWPRLRIRMKIDRVPVGADLGRKSADDAALRVYVAFDRGGTLFSPPNTIAYSWSDLPNGSEHIRSPHFKRLHYLSVGAGVTDDWVTIERNLLDDYRSIFKTEDVPPIVGVMLKCDSNNTDTQASAWLEELVLIGPGSP